MILVEQDLGTPEPRRASRNEVARSVELTVDGVAVSVPEGTSVMRAAALAGVDIPKLCATEKLDAFGSCRLCLVEIDGRKGTPASCTTLVSRGMSVTTQSPKLERMRRGVMELYISDHPLDCLSCPANGDCELQDMAGAVGLREVRYGYQVENHLDLPKDTSNPYFTFDSSKCIVCSRCVRACEEVQGTFALTIEGRGFGSRVAAGANGNFFDSPHGKLGDRTRHTAQNSPDHVRLLRRRMFIQSGDAGRTSRANGALQGRRRQRGPLLCEGPLCLGLRHASGPRHRTDDSRFH